MNNRVVSVSSLILVLVGLVATVCLFAFQYSLRKAGCNMEAAAGGTMILCLVGCILGWICFKSAEGKVSAILGTIMVLFFLAVLLYTSGESRQPMPKSPASPSTTGAAESIESAVGNCPKCNAVVAGNLVFWDGKDSDGKPRSGAEYRAVCKSCGASLFSREEPDPKTRMLKWQAVLTHTDSNKAPEAMRDPRAPDPGR